MLGGLKVFRIGQSDAAGFYASSSIHCSVETALNTFYPKLLDSFSPFLYNNCLHFSSFGCCGFHVSQCLYVGQVKCCLVQCVYCSAEFGKAVKKDPTQASQSCFCSQWRWEQWSAPRQTDHFTQQKGPTNTGNTKQLFT